MNHMQALGPMLGGMGGNNNPMAMIMQLMQSGGNPQQMLMQMAQQNPQLKQIMPLIKGKNPQQITETAKNLCRERGVDYNQMAGQLSQQMKQFGQFVPK